jgi:RNA-binding protein 25
LAAATAAAAKVQPLAPAVLAAQAAANAALVAQQFAAKFAASVGTATSSSQAAEIDPKLKLKQIVDRIPTKRAELFAYTVEWEVVDRCDLVETVMRPWVVKKIIEYLGEEEETLTNYIITNLKAHCHPTDLLEELSMVLDEDSEQFVLKLWRMLIYHACLKLSQ